MEYRYEKFPFNFGDQFEIEKYKRGNRELLKKLFKTETHYFEAFRII